MKKWDDDGKLREEHSRPDLQPVVWFKTGMRNLARTKLRHTMRRNAVRGLFTPNKQPLALRIDVKIAGLLDSFQRMVALESSHGTLFHFAPFIFGLGIVAYFLAPGEPVKIVLITSFLVSAAVASLIQNHGKLWVCICALALFFGGMSAGKIRTDQVNTRVPVQQTTGKISGTIIEVTRNQRGSVRYLIKPKLIEGINAQQLPNYIRLSASSKHRRGSPGETISGLARMQPISGPAYPGSFNFSFNSWYNGLGASGFFMGAPVTVAQKANAGYPTSMQFRIFINKFRITISNKIRAALPGESGDIAVALIIGDRTGIDRDTSESLRNSGLAHVLAISGMHMALVSLTMIWMVRLLLAMNMRLAVTRPIKNWAAIAGFVVATSYLAISGMGVATQRAWIMISVMLLAAIINRKSVTLRGVALAALVILAIQPESLLLPGFQMSFAAVAGIVAAYEWLEGRKKKNAEKPRANAVFRFFGTLIFTSLIAGLATSLFAAYHFQRIAPLGVLTNLLAMPLVSAIVMPSALLSVLAMPYGFEQLTLVPMGRGIDWVISISDYVNTLGGKGITGQLGASVLPLAFIGLFFLTMLKSRLRLIGVVILASSYFFWSGPPVPDVLLAENGRAIAVKGERDKLVMLYPRRNKFVRDIWLRAFSRDEQGKSEERESCNKDICIATTLQGAKVYVVYDPDLLPLACERADILLAPRLRWVNCRGNKPSLIVRRGQLEEFGAHAIYLERISPIAGNESEQASAQIEILISGGSSSAIKPGFKITSVKTAIINTIRPWNRHREGRADYLQD
ncbi:MAG: ComEC family competence protein [Rhizobiaceae bacterium]|nr:ComEC family competence protein [Rhizobiaceae bacterium]